LDEAAKFLAQGKSYDSWQLRFLSRGENHDEKLMERPEGLNSSFAILAFEDALKSQKDFIPNFRERLKEFSGGRADIVPINPDEIVKSPKPDAIYFHLARNVDGRIEDSVVALTPKGFSFVLLSDLLPNSLSKVRWESKVAKEFLSLPKTEANAMSSAEMMKVEIKAAGEFWLPMLRELRVKGRGSRTVNRYSVVKDMIVDASSIDRALKLLDQGESYGAAATFERVFGSRDEFIPRLQERIKELSKDRPELQLLTTKPDASYFKLIRHNAQGTDELNVKLTQEGFTVQSPSKEAELALPPTASLSERWGRVEAQVERSAASHDPVVDQIANSLVYTKPFNAASVRKLKGGMSVSARNALESFLSAPKDYIPKIQERVKEMSKGTSELIPIAPKEAVKAPKPGVLYFKLVRKSPEGDRALIVALNDQGFSLINPSETVLQKNPSRRPKYD
jgi:hypothetical protein